MNFRLAVGGRVHVSAGAAAEPAGAEGDRHPGRGRQRRDRLQGVHRGHLPVQRQG